MKVVFLHTFIEHLLLHRLYFAAGHRPGVVGHHGHALCDLVLPSADPFLPTAIYEKPHVNAPQPQTGSHPAFPLKPALALVEPSSVLDKLLDEVVQGRFHAAINRLAGSALKSVFPKGLEGEVYSRADICGFVIVLLYDLVAVLRLQTEFTPCGYASEEF